MDDDAVFLNDLSNRVIGCALAVVRILGMGFSEKVYENALALELRSCGLAVSQQRGVTVWFRGASVGTYTVDLLVEDALVLELKAVRALDGVHHAQCLNYLRATGLRLCLLINFGSPWLQIRRVVMGFDWWVWGWGVRGRRLFRRKVRN